VPDINTCLLCGANANKQVGGESILPAFEGGWLASASMRKALEACKDMCVVPLSAISNWKTEAQKRPSYVAEKIFTTSFAMTTSAEKVEQLALIVQVSFGR